MKHSSMGIWVTAGTLAGILAGFDAPAQDSPPAASPPPNSAAFAAPRTDSNPAPAVPARQNGQTQPAATASGKNSATVEEILKMVRAGVSKEVIRAYIEHAPLNSLPGAAEVIALKENGVPDDLTVAFVKRGADLMAQASLPSSNGSAPASTPPAYGDTSQLDPESYDFWWYHYAYPRALASANETLLSSYAPIAPYSYGYLPPLPFPPLPPSRHSRLR